MFRSSRCSRGSASVIATPSRPARPVRPMRCTYASADAGHVVVDDVRHVLDVEPARGDVGRDEELGVPSRNRRITRSRCSCDRPPCSASAR